MFIFVIAQGYAILDEKTLYFFGALTIHRKQNLCSVLVLLAPCSVEYLFNIYNNVYNSCSIFNYVGLGWFNLITLKKIRKKIIFYVEH